MVGNSSLKIFSGNANRSLAEAIAREYGTNLSPANVARFSDGETWIEIQDSVRGSDVFVIQPTSHPTNEHLVELLLMIDALKRASAERITAVIPYYGYARQDRKVSARTPISSKLVANLITTSGADRVLTMDLHAGQIQGFFDIPVDHLYAKPILLDYLKNELNDHLVVVSPDMGGAEMARSYAKQLGSPMALIDKRRPKPNVSEVMHLVGEVEGMRAVIIDDLVDTAGTLVQCANALKKHGATEVFACCTHPVLSGPAIERILQSGIKEMIVTDTIQLKEAAANSGKFKVISVAKILAEAIRRIHSFDSVSSLFV
ncbi:MAG: ribose-phosphate pyrophosphokinase [Pseudomonadota bacterium]